jgi:polysaccharide deacetylase 2 family uncharacterized protein YibQ
MDQEIIPSFVDERQEKTQQVQQLPQRVVEILMRQPLNPFHKLEITILPRVCQETK